MSILMKTTCDGCGKQKPEKADWASMTTYLDSTISGSKHWCSLECMLTLFKKLTAIVLERTRREDREGIERAKAAAKPSRRRVSPRCVDCGSTERDQSIPGDTVYLVHRKGCIQLEPVEAT